MLNHRNCNKPIVAMVVDRLTVARQRLRRGENTQIDGNLVPMLTLGLLLCSVGTMLSVDDDWLCWISWAESSVAVGYQVRAERFVRISIPELGRTADEEMTRAFASSGGVPFSIDSSQTGRYVAWEGNGNDEMTTNWYVWDERRREVVASWARIRRGVRWDGPSKFSYLSWTPSSDVVETVFDQDIRLATGWIRKAPTFDAPAIAWQFRIPDGLPQPRFPATLPRGDSVVWFDWWGSDERGGLIFHEWSPRRNAMTSRVTRLPPDWTGTNAVYSQTTNRFVLETMENTTRNYQLIVMERDGRRVEELISIPYFGGELTPTWSPDGRSVLVQLPSGNLQVLKLNAMEPVDGHDAE